MPAPRIVLVDDHALCRTGLSDLLRWAGFRWSQRAPFETMLESSVWSCAGSFSPPKSAQAALKRPVMP